MIGETLNKQYRVLSVLGTGRCGKTYLAEDNKATAEPRCVIKQFEPEAKDTLSLRKAKYLFAREVKILQILGKSDRIPTLLAYFHSEAKFYLVHEFIDGTDLTAELNSGVPWSAPEVVALLRELLEIVEVAHREKVIHQDIKPTNIIRRKADRKLILIDFGSVKKIYNQIANEEGRTQLTVPIGTPGYMAPEQKSIRSKLASDVYAIGAIGIYALTGVKPVDIPIKYETETLQWRSLAQVDEKLGQILDRMVSPNLKQRYGTASEALQTARNYKLGNKLFNLKIIAGLSALFLAIAGGGYYYWQLEKSIAQAPKGEYFATDKDRFPFLYQSVEYGVEIKYSASWKLSEPQGKQKIIAQFSPQKNQSDLITPEVALQVDALAVDSLEKYTTNRVYQITKLPQVKIIDSQPTTLDRRQAHKIIFTKADRTNGLEEKHLQIWTLEGDRAYTLTYQAKTEEYADFVNLVEEMFQSLKIDSNSQ